MVAHLPESHDEVPNLQADIYQDFLSGCDGGYIQNK